MLRAYCDGRDPVRRPLPRVEEQRGQRGNGAFFVNCPGHSIPIHKTGYPALS